MRAKPWIFTFAICAVIFASLGGYKAIQIRDAISFAESFPEPSESVESAYSKMLPYTKTLTVLGDVVPPKRVALYSETPGRVVKVGFVSGEKVQEGQILIQQDIGEETALLDAAKARLDLARTIYRRTKQMYDSDAVSEDALDRVRVEVTVIQAEIARLKATIRKKTIQAPFAGRTGIHQFEVGQFLLDNVLITHLIGDEGWLWVDFSVPQFYPELQQGQTVDVQLLRDVVTNQAASWVTAEVVARSAQVDRVNRSYRYRARVGTELLSASPNSGVSVKIPVVEASPEVSVPATSVQQDSLGSFVYLLQPDGAAGGHRAVRQGVKVLGKQGGRAYIKEGLEENQLVASDGAFKLYPGVLVHTGIGEDL